MLEWLLGWFAKSLCLFTQGFNPPFFLIMLIFFHLSEIKFKLIYIIFSLFIINLIIWFNVDVIIFIFSPNIKTFMLYSNLIDAVVLKIYLSFYLSLFFIFPYIVYAIWTYLRPGLFKFEDFLKFPYFWILKTLLFQIIIYYFLLTLYNWYLFDYIYSSVSTIDRFLPTLTQIIKLIKNLIYISLFLNYLIYFLKYIPFMVYYKKFRFYFIFITTLFLSLFLPPDINILLIITVINIIIYEGIYIIILNYKHIRLLLQKIIVLKNN